MNKVQHTPAPWKYEEVDYPAKVFEIFSGFEENEDGEYGEGKNICSTWQPDDYLEDSDSYRESLSNARLIAAAPQMLATLEWCQRYFDNPVSVTPGALVALQQAVNGAIKEALGL